MLPSALASGFTFLLPSRLISSSTCYAPNRLSHPASPLSHLWAFNSVPVSRSFVRRFCFPLVSPPNLSFGSSSVLTALSASCFLFHSRFPYSPCFLFCSRVLYSRCFPFCSRILYSRCFSRLTLDFSRVQPVSSLSRLPRFSAQSPLPRALYVRSSSALPQLCSSAPSLRILAPLSCVLAFPLHISVPLSGASALPLRISARRPASSLCCFFALPLRPSSRLSPFALPLTLRSHSAPYLFGPPRLLPLRVPSPDVLSPTVRHLKIFRPPFGLLLQSFFRSLIPSLSILFRGPVRFPVCFGLPCIRG